jgi:hypothetical protein
MKRIALGLVLALAACAPPPSDTPAVVAGKVTPASVCADILAVANAPDAARQLADLDPHSALGSLWADARAARPAGMPAGGVSSSWTAMVWGMARTLIPQLLPKLLPVLIGLV